jgi:hypothetical protein
LIGNYHFARDYGCVHPGMPLGRKHLRRSRDAPTLWDGPLKNYFYFAEEVSGSQMPDGTVTGRG